MSILDFLRENMLSCPIKSFTGIDCIGCGMQRSILALLEGDLQKSLEYYPSMIPIIIMFIYLALHIKFRFKHGAQVLKIAYIVNITLTVVAYIYKLFFI